MAASLYPTIDYVLGSQSESVAREQLQLLEKEYPSCKHQINTMLNLLKSENLTVCIQCFAGAKLILLPFENNLIIGFVSSKEDAMHYKLIVNYDGEILWGKQQFDTLQSNVDTKLLVSNSLLDVLHDRYETDKSICKRVQYVNCVFRTK